jgi:hypothetical protein
MFTSWIRFEGWLQAEPAGLDKYYELEAGFYPDDHQPANGNLNRETAKDL